MTRPHIVSGRAALEQRVQHDSCVVIPSQRQGPPDLRALLRVISTKSDSRYWREMDRRQPTLKVPEDAGMMGQFVVVA